MELLPGFETATATDELLVEIQAGSGVLSNDYPGGQGSNDMYGYYRYGFNGKENDNEVKGAGNQQDYGARFHDPRLGRFLSLDPCYASFPDQTPYSSSGNSPISHIDRDGKFAQWIVQYGINVGINVMTQMVTAFMFDDEVKTWGQAWDKTSLWQAFGEGAIDMIGTKKIKMAANAVMGMATYIDQVGIDNVTGSGLVGSGMIGLLEPVIGDAITRHGGKAVRKGLQKLGFNFDGAYSLFKNIGRESEGIKYVWDAVDAINSNKILGRGGIFEQRAWDKTYSKFGYSYVGQLKNRYFPHIDFWKDGIGISYKTTKANTKAGLKQFYTEISDLRKNLNKVLKGNQGEGEYLLREAELHIGVPEGYSTKYKSLFDDLKQYGANMGIKVQVDEIK